MLLFVPRTTAAAPPPPPPDVVAPDFYASEIGVYGLNTTSYLIGWPRAYDDVGVTEYEYSLDGGTAWTSTGTAVHAYVTGRTASATDQVRVRARDAAGNISSHLSRDITLPGASAVPVVMATVGVGGDYSTPQDAATALPSSLVTAGYCCEILLFNQEWVDSSATVLLDVAPRTTDATHTIRITAFPGCSMADHPRRRTNELRFNAANGAALRAVRGSGSSLPTVDLRSGFLTFDRLQVMSEPTAGYQSGGGWGVHTSSQTRPIRMDQCIVESSHYQFVESFNYGPSEANPHVLSRCVIISNRRSGSSPSMDRIGESGSQYIRHYNCLFVAVGQRAAFATAAHQNGIYFENCGFFGVDAIQDLGVAGSESPGPTYVNCFSDAPIGTLPSGVSSAPFDTSTFVNITGGSSSTIQHDLRLAAGSSLIGAGVVNSTQAARDITGKARGATNDVGPWQS